MASPFYIPTPNTFQNMVQARQQAQEDFAGKLSQLYAGGSQEAGQQLAGIAPSRVMAVKQALENMPGSQQNTLRERVDLLKKWHMAIDSEQDPANKAMMYNQMLAQVKAHGGDIASLAPSYDPASFKSQLMDTLSVEELLNQRKEQRLEASAGGTGTEWERADAELVNGNPQDETWKSKYIKYFLNPRPFVNPVTGATDMQFMTASPGVSRKAQSVGLPVNAPSRQLLSTAPIAAPEPAIPMAPPQAAAPATPDQATVPAVTAPVVAPKVAGAAEVPTTVIPGKPPEMSRAERERLAAEERDASRLKPMPTPLGEALLENRKSLRQLEQTKKLMENPDASKTLGISNMLPGSNLVAQYFGTPDQNNLRALISALQSMTYKNTSGATVTAAEERRLQQYIPTVNDRPDVAKTKVTRFLAEYQAIVKDVEDFINSQGYKPFTGGNQAAPTVPADKKSRAGF